VPLDGKLPTDEKLLYWLAVCLRIRWEVLKLNNVKSVKTDVLTLAIVGLLIGLAVVLRAYASIMLTPYARLSFDFVPLAIIAMRFGLVQAGTAAVIIDLVAFVLFPRGPFFPGLTLSAFLTGATYGIFLHKNPTKLTNIILAAVTVAVFIGLGLNTLWMSMLFNEAYMAMFVGRLVLTAIVLPLQIIILKTIAESLRMVKLL